MFRSHRRGSRTPQCLRTHLRAHARLALLLVLLLSASRTGSANSLESESVQYPSAEVAFICGPQLKSGSALNPFPWFDSTQRAHGHMHGQAMPSVGPRVLTGTVRVQSGSAVVTGSGTRFTLEVDPRGPAPLYNGWLRVRMPDGVTYREVKVASVESDGQMTLTAPWPFQTVSGAQADTMHFDTTQGTWNTDLYYNANYYDTALVQYLNYYRTGDPAFLTYARKTADAWWGSQWIGHGSVVGGPNYLPPRSQAFAGLMLRAMDGRPEMWDYLERTVRQTFDMWVKLRRSNPTLYWDIREDGYAQLYAVMLARVLPDSYPLYANGTDRAQTGTATDGAAKRAAFLRDAEDVAVNFFGRLQRPDGSWRWDVDLAADAANQFRDTEQPFMVGLYLESVVLLHQLTQDAGVKANLKQQLTRSVRHLFRDAYEGDHVVTDMPQYRWRGMLYWYGGGTVAQPGLLEPPLPRTSARGDVWEIRQARHLNSTLHHAFGYAFAVTGDEEFLRMGDEVFDASYGDRVDGIKGLADSGRAKDYDQNFRASGRYLAWRLQRQAPAAPPTVSISNPLDGAQFVEPVNITIGADAAASAGDISRVDFYAGSALLGTSTSRPFSFVWENAPAGSHVLTARATDSAGQTTASAGVRVQVNRANSSITRAKQNAQVVSNELAGAAANAAASSGGGTLAVSSQMSTLAKLSTVVADVQKAYDDFLVERGGYAAAARIETELVNALGHARIAESLAGSGATAEVQANLRKAIDALALAHVLMLHGDIPNPVRVAEYFVRQHYVDFLNREPDESGLAFWSGQITRCGADAACVASKRIDVSAAFFMSIEFKQTGYLVYRAHRATHGRMPLLAEFTADTQEISGGVVVNTTGWEARMEANKAAFFQRWAQRNDFRAIYDGMSNAQFVEALLTNMGVSYGAAERDALVADLNGGMQRGAALRRLVESEAYAQKELNPAFVLMQYFGYLRRDADNDGFNFWLTKLNRFGGDYRRAEMVKAFLDSGEYNGRFNRR